MDRNWKLLGELGKKNWFLMIAIATIDTTTHEGSKLEKAFREYYSPGAGPIPLSVLCEQSRKFWDDEQCDPRELIYQFLDQSGEFPELKAICTRFRHSNQTDVEHLEEIPPDLTVTKETDVGSSIEWRGGRFIVLENLNNDQLTIVPEEAVAVSL